MARISGCAAIAIGVALAIAAEVSRAQAHDLKPGLYAVDVVVTYPNLTNPLDQRTVEVCLSPAILEAHRGFRILSDVPQASCPAIPICFGNGRAGFQSICPGENSGEAVGEFTFRTQRFSGVVRMKLGGKNMTLIERQSGIWIGPCP